MNERPHAWPMREIINIIFYVMRAGRPGHLLPSDLPPGSTIYRWFAKFRLVLEPHPASIQDRDGGGPLRKL